MAESIMMSIGVLSLTMAVVFSCIKFVSDINKESRKNQIVKYTFQNK